MEFGLTILHTLFFLEICQVWRKKETKYGCVNCKHNLCFDEKLRYSNISDLQRKELTNGFGAQQEILNHYIHLISLNILDFLIFLCPKPKIWFHRFVICQLVSTEASARSVLGVVFRARSFSSVSPSKCLHQLPLTLLCFK